MELIEKFKKHIMEEMKVYNAKIWQDNLNGIEDDFANRLLFFSEKIDRKTLPVYQPALLFFIFLIISTFLSLFLNFDLWKNLLLAIFSIVSFLSIVAMLYPTKKRKEKEKSEFLTSLIPLKVFHKKNANNSYQYNEKLIDNFFYNDEFDYDSDYIQMLRKPVTEKTKSMIEECFSKEIIKVWLYLKNIDQQEDRKMVITNGDLIRLFKIYENFEPVECVFQEIFFPKNKTQHGSVCKNN